MFRRLVVAGLAAGLAAPIFVVTPPASAAVLVTCTNVAGGVQITPGLGHTQTAQSDVDSSINVAGCNNGQPGAAFFTGQGIFNPNPTTTFPSRPLGCPVGLGGVGPDYSDQTPILFGNDPGFLLDWDAGTDSTGITKVKQGPVPTQVRLVLVITAGQYAPPAGKKTKFKGTFTLQPTGAWDCQDNDQQSRIESANVTNSGNFIVQQV
jgi:hypothetical protein